MNRLGIYFFYDASGIVDEYIVTFLTALNDHLTKLIVVCNGTLTSESRSRFEELGASVLVRENSGFDVWAYKAGIDHVGWDALESFDEIVMVNFTIMGPVGSFTPMFAEMESRDLDFWGITAHHGAAFDPWGKMPNGFIPWHIQSHFIAVRQRMTRSVEFHRYWDRMGPIDSYEDSIAKHEALFTERFESFGFRSGTYVDTSDLVKVMFYPLFNDPVGMIQSRHSPIFKRKIFFSSPETFLDENSNRPARQLADYLRNSEDYDFKQVSDHILRSSNQYDITMALNNIEVLPTRSLEIAPPFRIALIIGLESMASLDGKLSYIRNLDGSSDIFVATSDDESAINVAFQAAGLQTPQVRANLLPGFNALEEWADETVDYELLCVLESSIEKLDFPATNHLAAKNHNLDGVLANEAYIQGLLGLFASDQSVGLVVPSPPIHHDHFGRLGHEWDGAFEPVSEFLRSADIVVSMSSDKAPVAPNGGVFWLRARALSPQLRRRAVSELSTSQFRLALPLLVQHLGYQAIFVAPDFSASNLLTTFTHAVRTINGRVGEGVSDRFSALQHRLAISGSSLPKSALSGAKMYVDMGLGFTERSSVEPMAAVPGTESDLILRFKIPVGARQLRFDPIEGTGIVARGARAQSNLGHDLVLRPLNGDRNGQTDLFATVDPQYSLRWDEGEADTVSVSFESFTRLPGAPDSYKGFMRPFGALRASFSRIVTRHFNPR